MMKRRSTPGGGPRENPQIVNHDEVKLEVEQQQNKAEAEAEEVEETLQQHGASDLGYTDNQSPKRLVKQLRGVQNAGVYSSIPFGYNEISRGGGVAGRQNLPSEFFMRSGAMDSKSMSINAPGIRGLQSRGSKGNFHNHKVGDSTMRRSSALRITKKVEQVKAPDTTEEEFSGDSNEEVAAQMSPQTQKINAKTNLFVQDDAPAQKLIKQNKNSLKTPVLKKDNPKIFLEEPLCEEAMPEHNSYVKSQRSQSRHKAQNSKNFFRSSQNDLNIPKQPSAHEDPPIGIDNTPASILMKAKGREQNLLLAEAGAAAQEQQRFKGIRVAALDPINHNGLPTEQESSLSDDIQFPQDVLFTNAEATPNKVMTRQQQQQQQQLGQQDNNVYQLDVPMQNEDNNRIKPKHTSSYVKLKAELDDSNVYFLNQLRREFDGDTHYSRLYTEHRQFEQEQSSFPNMSALNMPAEALGHQNLYTDNDINRSGLFLDQISPTKKNGGKSKEVTSSSLASKVQSAQEATRSASLANQKITRINSNHDELRLAGNDNSASKAQIRDLRQDGSFLRDAEQEDSRLGRSIAVDSADFDESKLLTTERKVLWQTELGKEGVKMQNGAWLQDMINQSKPNETIYLESITYKFQSLFITCPVTLIGQPETILEIDGGSIIIDFRKNTEIMLAGADQDELIQQTPGATPYKTNEARSHPLSRGTPLTIKKNRVARIQVCEIRYNRTKASIQTMLQNKQQILTPTRLTSQNNRDQQQFSHEISLGASNPVSNNQQYYNNHNNHNQQPSQTMMNTDMSNNNVNQISNHNSRVNNNETKIQGQQSPVSCFVIENNSFIEIKDCCIKSVKDKKNFDQELDHFFRNKNASTRVNSATGINTPFQTAHSTTNIIQNEKIGATIDNIQFEKGDFTELMRRQDNEIRDYCFTLNLPEEASGRQSIADYSGLVSLCSTTIQNFMYGIYCGQDAIVTCETSSFIALRAGGCAIKSHSPKLLKVMNGTIQKCEAHGIQITFDKIDSPPPRSNTMTQNDFGSTAAGMLSRQGSIHTPLLVRQQSQAQYEVLTTDPYESGVDAYTTMIQRLTRKVYIENNRIVQVQGCPISIEGPASEHYLQYFIKVKDNRISNCGLESKLYAIPGCSEQEKENEQVLAKQAYARIGGPPKACILLQNLHIFDLSCFRNTISKGSGSGITISNVKGHREDMTQVNNLPTTEQEAKKVFDLCVGDQQRVAVVDNYVIETSEGYGMVIESSTCFMEENQLKKNALGGLLITSTVPLNKSTANMNMTNQDKSLIKPSKLDNIMEDREQFETARSEEGAAAENIQRAPVFQQQENHSPFENLKSKESQKGQLCKLNQKRLHQLKQFCSITIEKSTALNNQKFGIGVLGFFGSLVVMNTQCNENETEGMVFARHRNDPCLLYRQEVLEDEAQYIDLADCTERSSKHITTQQRSRTANKIDQTEMSYRQDGLPQISLVQDSVLQHFDRPFEKLVQNVMLLKCVVQQNRQDGIKSVDYSVQALGCTIQGNMSSAIRLYQLDKGAECQIYLKARNNDTDLIGQILAGKTNTTRYKPKVSIDPNLNQLLEALIKAQMIAAYVEMIQMNQQEPETDIRQSIVTKNNESKLIRLLESQKEIISQRDPRQNKNQKSSGFFANLFKCCVCNTSNSKSARSNYTKNDDRLPERRKLQSNDQKISKIVLKK